MFGLFKKKTQLEKLQEKYEQLLAESFKLSHNNRMASDQKRAEAEEIMEKIVLLQKQKT